MTLVDVDNAQRVEAASWALANGLQFLWGNTASRDPHAAPSLVWRFEPETQDRLTGATVLHRGTTRASIYLPAGAGLLAALALAEGLQSLFRGRVYAGSMTLDTITIEIFGREAGSYRVDVSIPWEYDEQRIPQGAVGLYETPGAIVAYQAARQLWELRVRAPLSLVTHFDSSPPADVVAPFAVVRFRTLQPIPVEIRTLRVPGRLLVNLHEPLGAGVTAGSETADAIVRAFDEVSYRGVIFHTPAINVIGRTPIETWQVNVRLPFHYEVRT